MKVILIADVKNVGKKGEVVDVSEGYATNFLIKKRLAILQNKANLNDLNKQKEEEKRLDIANREKAMNLKNKLNTITVIFKEHPGTEGRLHSAITSKMLEEKLAKMKSEGRVDVANKISIARSFGDISENSEYDAAREEEAILEQEIIQIEETLRNAQIISKSHSDTSVVGVGAMLEVYDMEFEESLNLKIMGSIESDPTIGQISNESPLGRALIGKSKNDIVEVSTPAGVQKYKILSIKY